MCENIKGIKRFEVELQEVWCITKYGPHSQGAWQNSDESLIAWKNRYLQLKLSSNFAILDSLPILEYTVHMDAVSPRQDHQAFLLTFLLPNNDGVC